jgi:serine protease AprX
MARNRLVCLVWVLLSVSFSAWSQENRYMVFFKDKSGIPQSLSQPIEFLSERAIQRRLDQNIAITEKDLPVNRDYVGSVKDAGASTFYTTRWMNGVLVSCTPSTIATIETLPFVEKVEYVAPPVKTNSGGRRSFTARKNNNNVSGETEVQLKMIGLDWMHRAGYTGEGVVIAILDSGFPGVAQGVGFQHMLSDGRIDQQTSYDFVRNTSNVFGGDDHGTEVFSVIAGLLPDAFTGGAYDATFQLFITEDVPAEYRIEEYNWLFAAEKADSAGADIIHSSLGYYDFDDSAMNYTVEDMDGKTTVVTRAAQWAADRGIVVVTSAGNEGSIPSWRIITAPADGVDVLAVGGVNGVGTKVMSSSIGPTADGRIKPDVAALGSSVKVLKASGQISTASGTSLSAPLVTSLVAGIIQRYPELTARQVIDLVRQTSSQAAKPDNLLGYGIPNFQAIVNYQDRHEQTEPFEVYPNPLRDRDTLIIRPKDPEPFYSCQVEILSSQGSLISSTMVKFDWLNNSFRTTLTGLPAGIYYVRLISGRDRNTFRVVKLR